MPAGVAESDVVSRIVGDFDLIEPFPPDVIPTAPIPKKRRDTQILASSIAQRSTSRPDEVTVTEI